MIHFQGKRRRFVSKIICNEIMRNKISSSRNLVNIRRVDLIISIVDIKKNLESHFKTFIHINLHKFCSATQKC